MRCFSDIVAKFKTNRILHGLLTLVLSGLLASCSSTPSHPRSYPVSASHKLIPEKVVTLARHMLGRPYHYGGDTPSEGFDCSGLVYYSFEHAGISLPRTSYGQFKASRPIAMRHLQAGDLVFFQFRRGVISHVGIYMGDHRFIHAPSGGKSVTIDSLNDPYWRYHFVRGGRAL